MIRDRTSVLSLLPVLLALLAYVNTLNHEFALDDYTLVVRNQHLHSLGEIPSYFTSSRTQAAKDLKVYRPVRTSMYALQYAAFGLNPRGYHAVNVLLHCANVLLLSLLLRRIGLDIGRALVAAVLFAVHPLATESVANITGQTDLLFLLFYLAALIFAVRADDGRQRTAMMVLSLASYALSLLSKEMAISFPLLLIALDGYRYRGNAGRYRGRMPLYAGSALISFLYILLRTRVIEAGWEWEYYGDSFLTTLFTVTRVIVAYLRLFFAPYPQSARYDVALIETPFNVYTAVVIVLLAALVICTVRNMRTGGPLTVLFGFWWFAITLLPVSHLRPIPISMMGERFLYLPMIGLIISLAALEFPRWISKRVRAALPIVGVIVVVVLLSLTAVRNRVWRNNLTLGEDTREKAPDSLLVRWMLVVEYRKRGDAAKAEIEFNEMRRITEQAAREHLQRARLYREQGRFALAERRARKALVADPDLEEAREMLRSLGSGTSGGN